MNFIDPRTRLDADRYRMECLLVMHASLI